MTCIKTGARVLIENYNQVYAADLHTVGDCTIIHYNPNGSHRSEFPTNRITHVAFIDSNAYLHKPIDGHYTAVVKTNTIVEMPKYEHL